MLKFIPSRGTAQVPQDAFHLVGVDGLVLQRLDSGRRKKNTPV